MTFRIVTPRQHLPPIGIGTTAFHHANYDVSTLTIAAINTLRPNASEISTKSPFDCVQAAQAKKLRTKMPMNSARIDFHKLLVLAVSSFAPNVYFIVILLA